ncbi:coiled-coil-helix-coiled-coil-helix domain-containing protein 7 [Galendromus occidentalis]|uniref:Coiled-coil-helix-coiled-coil-helix domain-containing protein 7 n=1 Tax=Galendromus occidentalis TaxID=34638 RepID=A0AAJ6VWY8_9ACAR|nr:coiled-coil-helix-coiled-coil-helix domain-containing protein 7 [Galendromus occidentalis]
MSAGGNLAERNPCHKESELSLECLFRNSDDRDKCHVYFENYKVCKKFWDHVRKDRMRKGLNPALPPLAEREAVKKEYLTRPGR